MSFLDKLFRFRAKPHVGKQKTAEKSAAAFPISKKQEAKLGASAPRAVSSRISQVLLGAITTEKTTRGTAKENSYTFIVSRTATKGEVREAVWGIYGVTPIKVNMVRVRGKPVRFGRTSGKQKDWKKAIVSLKDGESISFASGEGN